MSFRRQKPKRDRSDRDYAREERLRGATPQDRFREDVVSIAEQRQETGGYPDDIIGWIDSSPGTNMMESPPLSQSEANKVARMLGIPLPDGSIYPIGGNKYAIDGPITPNMAEVWLTKFNIENRIAGKANFQGIENDINEGKWIPTHQGFAFSVGRELGQLLPILLDGQHRARGIFNAGYPVRGIVVINVLPEAVRVMDTHMIRTVRTLIELGGKSMRGLMENAVKFAILGPVTKSRKVTVNEQWYFATQSMDILERVDTITRKNIKNVTLASVLGCAIRALLSTPPSDDTRRERIYTWLEILQQGVQYPSASEPENSSALYFREWLQNRQGNLNGWEIYLRTAYMLQLFLERHTEPLKQVRKITGVWKNSPLEIDPFRLSDQIQKGLDGQLSSSGNSVETVSVESASTKEQEPVLR